MFFVCLFVVVFLMFFFFFFFFVLLLFIYLFFCGGGLFCFVLLLLLLFCFLFGFYAAVKIISPILSRVNHKMGRKREIPEKKHLNTRQQNLACLTCDPG